MLIVGCRATSSGRPTSRSWGAGWLAPSRLPAGQPGRASPATTRPTVRWVQLAKAGRALAVEWGVMRRAIFAAERCGRSPLHCRPTTGPYTGMLRCSTSTIGPTLDSRHGHAGRRGAGRRAMRPRHSPRSACASGSAWSLVDIEIGLRSFGEAARRVQGLFCEHAGTHVGRQPRTVARMS